MEKPTIPGPDETILALEPLRPLLWEALEAGIAAAKAYFDEAGKVPGCLGSHLTRFHARQHLVERGIDCDSIANDGILFIWGDFCVRVLKADEGELPAPGTSEKRQAFYSQQGRLGLTDANGRDVASRVNLIVFWDVRPVSFNDLSLNLACPKGGGTTRDSVETYWERALVHPAELTAAVDAMGDTSGDLPIGELDSEAVGGDDDEDQ